MRIRLPPSVQLVLSVIFYFGAVVTGVTVAITVGVTTTNLDGDCPLYGHVLWKGDNNTFITRLHHTEACSFVTYLNIAVPVIAVLVAVLFIIFGLCKGLASKILSKWCVSIATSIHSIILILVLASCFVLTIGLNTFCEGMEQKEDIVRCADTQFPQWALSWKSNNEKYDAGTFHQYLSIAKKALWSSFAFWVAQLVLDIACLIQNRKKWFVKIPATHYSIRPCNDPGTVVPLQQLPKEEDVVESVDCARPQSEGSVNDDDDDDDEEGEDNVDDDKETFDEDVETAPQTTSMPLGYIPVPGTVGTVLGGYQAMVPAHAVLMPGLQGMQVVTVPGYMASPAVGGVHMVQTVPVTSPPLNIPVNSAGTSVVLKFESENQRCSVVKKKTNGETKSVKPKLNVKPSRPVSSTPKIQTESPLSKTQSPCLSRAQSQEAQSVHAEPSAPQASPPVVPKRSAHPKMLPKRASEPCLRKKAPAPPPPYSAIKPKYTRGKSTET